jgi:benzoyl-CoA reductase/2-hydroxyglutaryl-CoA dehydratase subunit BcrC/BadD/HgdB
MPEAGLGENTGSVRAVREGHMEKNEAAQAMKSAKTLKTAQEAGYFGKKMLTQAIEAKEEGYPIGWSMVTWWEGDFIAKALGMYLVYPENYGAFCAASRKAEPYLEIADSEGFPNSLCGYARNCLGYAKSLMSNNYVIPRDAPGGGLAKPAVLIGCGAACDARYKWFQALGRYFNGVPVWTLELPQTGVKEYYIPGNKEKNIRFIVSELREFVSFLENLLKKKLDYDKLSEMLSQSLKTLELAWKVDMLRKSVPSPMVAQDFWSVMIAHFYLPEDPESYAFYQRVYDEVKAKVDNQISAIPNEKYRMMFSELPPWHSVGFFDQLAEKYGIAMAIESWNYHAPTPMPEEELDGVSDPLEIIARLSYHKWTEHNAVAREFDSAPGYFSAAYLKWAREYRIDGLFAHPLMSCRPATYTLMHTRNVLEEKLRVPGVIVPGDIIDLRVFNPKEALSRVEAFLETMDHYRDLRKQAGMEW